MAKEPHAVSAMMALMKAWISYVLLGANFVLLVALVGLFVFRGTVLSPPWDGPAVVTILLTVVTIVLAAVGVGVALLAIWGFAALREYAANRAETVAEATVDKAVERKLQQLLREWGVLDSDGDAGGEEVARAYQKEE